MERLELLTLRDLYGDGLKTVPSIDKLRDEALPLQAVDETLEAVVFGSSQLQDLPSVGGLLEVDVRRILQADVHESRTHLVTVSFTYMFIARLPMNAHSPTVFKDLGQAQAFR